MIDYKIYQKALDIIIRETIETPEQKASAICELFDEQKTKSSLNGTQTMPLGGYNYSKGIPTDTLSWNNAATIADCTRISN